MTEIVKPHHVFPKLDNLMTRMVELRVEMLTVADDQIRPLQEKLEKSGIFGTATRGHIVPSGWPGPNANEEHNRRRKEKLDGLMGEFAESEWPDTPPVVAPNPDYDEWYRLIRENDLRQQAYNKLAEQWPALYRKACQELVKLVKPDYTLIARERAAALIALGENELRQQKFLEERSDAVEGVGLLDLGSIAIGLGNPLERSSGFYRGLLRLVECGHVDISIIPQHWGSKP